MENKNSDTLTTDNMLSASGFSLFFLPSVTATSKFTLQTTVITRTSNNIRILDELNDILSRKPPGNLMREYADVFYILKVVKQYYI